MRNRFIQYERTEVIGKTAGRQATARAREDNRLIDCRLSKQRSRWTFRKSNMTVVLNKDAGSTPAGLVLSVSHEIGRMLLHRRLASILERELVKVDAVIEGGFEEFIDAMELCAGE